MLSLPWIELASQAPAMRPCKAKLRSRSERGGLGLSSDGPMAGKYWKQEKSLASAAVRCASAGLGSWSGWDSACPFSNGPDRKPSMAGE